MSRYSGRLLNIFTNIPENVVLTSQWLHSQGISDKLVWRYVNSGWLVRLGKKAYTKTGATINWQGVVVALQQQLQCPVHIGGKSALQLLGQAHYIPVAGVSQVTLLAPLNTKLPTWFDKLNAENLQFQVYRSNLFGEKVTDSKYITRNIEGFDIVLSMPECAMMEAIYLLEKQTTFEELRQLMQGLSSLRVNIVQTLLEQCRSIKVKRLFLYLAEVSDHRWYDKINVNTINLGAGKRVIAGGGHYIPKFKISVPKTKDFLADDIP